jgi:hypothetical protein
MLKKELYFLVAMIILSNNLYASLGVKVYPNQWDIGTGGAGDYTTWSVETLPGEGYFAVENIGTESAQVNIRATDTQHWTLSTVPGLNTFTVKWGQTIIQGEEPVWENIGLSDSVLCSSLVAGSTFYFDLLYQSPTEIEPIDLTENPDLHCNYICSFSCPGPLVNSNG